MARSSTHGDAWDAAATPLGAGLARARAWLARPLVLAAAMVGIDALAYLVPFPLVRWYSTPLTSFALISERSAGSALTLALAAVALVLVSWQAWRTLPRLPQRQAVLLLVGGWLAASAVLLWVYPGQSTDLGDYMFRAHMLVHLGQNPLTVPPSDLVTREAFPFLAWYWEPDPYGPLWHWPAGLAHLLAGESVLANFLAFKLLAVIATGSAGALIWAILRQIAPEHAVAGTALWLWNPLVLNESAIHGHNDLILVPITLAGLWLLLRDRRSLGLLLLAAAGLVKVTAWILLPVAGVWLLRRLGWRQTLRAALPAALAGAALTVLVYLPFGGPQRLFDLAQRRGWWPTNTWTAAVFFALRDGARWPHAQAVKVVINTANGLFVLAAGLVLAKTRDLRRGAWAMVMAYLLVGTHWFQPWYAVWPAALAAILPDRRITRYAFIFTLLMLVHPILANYLGPQLTLPPGGYHAVMAATTLLVPQALALRLAWPSIRSTRIPSAPHS